VTNEWGYIGRLLGNTARDIQIEIITRGPVACMVNPMPLFDYKAGYNNHLNRKRRNGAMSRSE
jgi:hypothetical protein